MSLPWTAGSLAYPQYAQNRCVLAFSPDGKILAAVGLRDIKLFDASTGRLVKTLRCQIGEFTYAAFSPDGKWLASSGTDDGVRIWDTRLWTEAAALIMARYTNDWLVISPNGLFDGTLPALQRLVAWRFADNQVAPPELFFNEYYYPGLLGEILKDKAPQPPRELGQVDRRQPRLELRLVSEAQSENRRSFPRNVQLLIKVAEIRGAKEVRGSGVRDVRLFRNDSLIKLWRGDIQLDEQGTATLEATIPIVAGKNQLTAYAFNRENIKSADAALMIEGDGSLKRQASAYILTAGVNRYANPDYNLSFAVSDAQAVGQELLRQLTGLGEYGKIEMIPLLDQQMTKSNLLLVLERLTGENTGPLPAGLPAALTKIEPCQPEDAVFIFFAGHGTAAGPRFYLIPYDLGYQGKRTELDEVGLKTILDHSISDQELERAFEKLDAAHILLIIDACNSGQALEAEEKRRGPMNSKGLAQLAYEKGMYILTAAQGYQAALEAEKLGHGLLTQALVEDGLKSAAADTAPKDGKISVREWLSYPTQRVPQLQEETMEGARKLGRDIVFAEGEENIKDPAKRSLQRPRVFYRREAESVPFIIAKPPAKPDPKR